MAGLTNGESQSTLDARFPTTGGTDHVAYSTNGSLRVRRPCPDSHRCDRLGGGYGCRSFGEGERERAHLGGRLVGRHRDALRDLLGADLGYAAHRLDGPRGIPHGRDRRPARRTPSARSASPSRKEALCLGSP